MFGSSQQPYIQEYMIGPMSQRNQITAQPLTFLSTRKVDTKLRVYDSDFEAGDNLTSLIKSQAADIIKTMWEVVCGTPAWSLENNFMLTTAF